VATPPNYPRWRCFRRESTDIALCEKARIRQAGFFPNQFFKENFSMDGTVDELLVLVAKQVNGRQKRILIAAVCEKLCDGSARKTEERFGWGREAIAKGLLEVFKTHR